MKTIKRSGLVAAACLLVVAAVALIRPKAVQAVIATLIRDQDNPGRNPFVANIEILVGEGATLASANGVPGTARFVVEHVSGACTSTAVPSLVLGVRTSSQINAFTSTEQWKSLVLPPMLTVTATNQRYFSASERMYVDPTDFFSNVLASTDANASCRVSFSGYLINLP